MKKILIALLAFTISLNPTNYKVNAQGDDSVVCQFVDNADGELVEVCEEVIPDPYILCTLECWDA